MRTPYWSVCLLFAILLSACGGSNADAPTTPQISGDDLTNQTTAMGSPNRILWGYWNVTIDPDALEANVVPKRAVQLHINTLKFLEVSPCTDCLTISNIRHPSALEVTADLTLRHPFPDNYRLAGFDVRGILITNGAYTFSGGLKCSGWGGNSIRMLNADGYTCLFNQARYPDVPGQDIFTYFPGNLSNGSTFTSTLNPFIAYREDQPRRVYNSGAVEKEYVHLRGTGGPISFGYAVDACWAPPSTPVFDPVFDFPPNANCLEAYDIQADVDHDISPGSPSPTIEVVVFDHQGLETIDSVTIEAPDLFNGIKSLSYSGTTVDGGFKYTGLLNGSASEGPHPVLIRVEDTASDPHFGVVCAMDILTVRVRKGWAGTWGGGGNDRVNGIFGSGDGGLYMTGSFQGLADLDPGLEIELAESQGSDDVYLIKTFNDGDLDWGWSWGGGFSDAGFDLAVTEDNQLVVLGTFKTAINDYIDFDPRPPDDENRYEDFITSDGRQLLFLSFYELTGEYIGTCTFGGAVEHTASELVPAPDGGFYIAGSFRGESNFDPGGKYTLVSTGGSLYHDAYLMKVDGIADPDLDPPVQMNLLWANSWGSVNYDDADGIAVDPGGNIFVTGEFRDTADFDPGDQAEIRYTNGFGDVYLSKFNSQGDLSWVRTWGGWSYEEGSDVAAAPDGSVYVTGTYLGQVDFDPGPESLMHISRGLGDVFVSKFDSEGEFKWVRCWGEDGHEDGLAVETTDLGFVYVAGLFSESPDFNPGPDTFRLVSVGNFDAYVSKFDSNGNFEWARSWGDHLPDVAHELMSDFNENVYVAGYFAGNIDFDPGPGIAKFRFYGGSDAFLTRLGDDGYW